MSIDFFSSLVQSLICLFAGTILYSIYLKKTPILDQESQVSLTRDKGIFWLSIAVLVWAIAGFLHLLLPAQGTYGEYFKLLIRIFASTINNASLLIAVAFFEHGPQDIKVFNIFVFNKLQTSKKWRNFVIAASFAVMAITIIIYLFFFSNNEPTSSTIWAFNVFDLSLTLLTLFILGVSLWKSLTSRGYYLLSLLLLIVFIIVFSANVFDAYVSSLGINSSKFFKELDCLLILMNKILFIFMLLSLVISWNAGISDQLASYVSQLLRDKSQTENDNLTLLKKITSSENRVIDQNSTGRAEDANFYSTAKTEIGRLLGNQLVFEDRLNDQNIYMGLEGGVVNLQVPELSIARLVKLTEVPYRNLLLFAFFQKRNLNTGYIKLKEYNLTSRDIDRLVQEFLDKDRVIKAELESIEIDDFRKLKGVLFRKGFVDWKLSIPADNILGLETNQLQKLVNYYHNRPGDKIIIDTIKKYLE